MLRTGFGIALVLLFGVSDALGQLDSTALGFTRFFYEDGTVSSEGQMVNGQPDGYWQTYYPDGTLKTRGNRVDGILNGVWDFFRQDGTPERSITYADGKRDGLEKTFSADGNLIAEISWKVDSKEGEARYYYESGELYRTLEFVANKEEGKGFEYGKDGRIITFLSYKDGFLRSIEKVNRLNSSGQQTGYWVEFYPNGRVKWEGNFTGGLKNGIFKFYTKRGDLDRLEKYQAGELIEDADETVVLDIRKEYYADGSVKMIGSYREGSRQGVFRSYDQEGQVESSTLYENNIKVGEGIMDKEGREQGDWILFYPTGETFAEGAYEDGKRIGLWKFYHQNGKLSQKGNYRDGLSHGDWTWYFENGSVKREEGYRKGKEDGEFIEYDQVGEVIHKGAYIDGYKNGPWFYLVNDHKETGEFIDGEKTGQWEAVYSDTGKTYFKGEYLNGVAIGKHKYFYPNGRVKLEGKYTGGVRDGDWKYYDESGYTEIVVKYKNGEKVRINGGKLPKDFEE